MLTVHNCRTKGMSAVVEDTSDAGEGDTPDALLKGEKMYEYTSLYSIYILNKLLALKGKVLMLMNLLILMWRISIWQTLSPGTMFFSQLITPFNTDILFR